MDRRVIEMCKQSRDAELSLARIDQMLEVWIWNDLSHEETSTPRNS